jgi:hypothetical protein
MDTISFTQSAGCPQLYLSGPRLAFLLPRGAAPSPPNLAAGWDAGAPGCYLFLAAPPAPEQHAALAAAAWAWLEQRRNQGARLAWVANPTAIGQGLRGHILALARDGAAWRTDRLTQIELGGLLLLIAKGSAVALAPDSAALTIAPRTSGSSALLSASGARYLLAGPLTLPLAGPLAGCLRGTLTLANAGIPDRLADLNAGLRVFVPDPALPAGDGPSFVTSLRYPLLSPDPADWARYGRDLALYPTLDPLAPLDADRTFFAFVGPDGAAPADLPSCYRTNIGYTVHLTPRDQRSRLVLAPKPAATAPDGAGASYLTPAGDFALSVPRYDPAASQDPHDYDDNLLCGMSGVEYVKLDPDRLNLLTFVPGQPAFAPGFVLGASAAGNAAGALTGLATTSWAYPRQAALASGGAAGGVPIYYAQPDQAVLYAPGPPAGAGSAEALLQFMEVPAAALPAPGDHAAPAFPLFPYGGVRADPDRGIALADFLQVEQQRLMPTRRDQVHAIAQAATEPLPAPRRPLTLGDEPATTTGTTPQGLLATFADGYETLATLFLARDTADNFLTFEQIARGTPLRAALQSNQVFLVISDPAKLKPIFARHALNIQGWTFDLDPDAWGQHGTILIFKFHDKPLLDLADDPQIWALPSEFNLRPAATRRQLTGLLRDAVAKAGPDSTPKERESYAQLARAASDPSWSGIIALNVALAGGGDAAEQGGQVASALPSELRALAGGIDGAKFMAQYVGIATTPITAQDGQLSAGQSSLFGLIDYRDDAPPLPSDSGFNFQVTRLQVLFGNSQIKSFASDISVTLDTLFGEPTALRDSASGRNIVVLKGTAEDHGGHTTYAFSFSGDNHFGLPESAVIGDVEILKAQFATDPPAADAPDSTAGRFTFWGRLNFRRLAKFDVLSFGPEDDPAAPGETFLSFAGLVVTMRFPTARPHERAFAFEPRGMTFDIRRSRPRAESLYAKFPLKFTGMLYSSGPTDKQLDEYGFMPVKTPLGGRKIEPGAWYALTFDLDLGSGGALAGQSLVASIVAAWAPGQPNLFVGLRLPGSSGGKREIALQGVLKIVFKSIEFVVGDADGAASYLLKLKNIQLKFMVLSIPPSGQTEIIIFGDPHASPDSETKTVGWYAAYAKEPPPAPPAQSPLFPTR